ncbi:hypothetical protein Taro_039859 [Colocasia esculenta]|uniref:Aminotransferase-like plant mobile domain-containing protein n=1 Tax=Colocasia esculenta TaxID=4460 RepID=A0A843WRC9_COLES|nr:hypothetical protein [Colocasia esculenta]
MRFGEIFRIERMRVDSALTQALRSRWDAEATTFLFPRRHMIPSLEDVSRIIGLRVYGKPVSGFTYPCYHDLAERLLELPVERRSSLVPRVALQASLGLYEAGKSAGESEDEYLERLVMVSRRELASEPRAEADMDLRCFLVLFLGRLLFATRGDAVHCRFLPLLEDLSEVRGYAWGADFLAHQFDSLGASVSGLIYISQPWGEGISRGRALCPLHAARIIAEIHVISGTSWSDFGRPLIATPTKIHTWGRVMRDSPGWCRPVPTSVDVAGEIASLRALLYSAVQDREGAQRQTAELRRELKRVRSTGTGGASSSRGEGGSPSLLEAQLAGAVLRVEEAQRHLEEREIDLRLTTEHAMDLQGQRDQLQGQRDQLQGEIQTTRRERDQLRIRAEAAEAQVAEATKELAALRVQGPPADQAEMVRLSTEVMAQQIRIDELRGMVKTLGEAARSRSRTGVSGASGASVRQYLAGSSNRQRNEEDERRHRGEGRAQGDRDGGEMPPPADRQEGSGESGGGQ